MSRSHKKVPVIKDEQHNKRKTKRRASKAVRRDWKVSDGGSYKKLFDSWEINDWRSWLWPLSKWHDPPTDEMVRRFWNK